MSATFSDFEPPVFNNLTSAIRALAMDAVQRLIGPNNLHLMTDNHRNHARYMSALLQDFDPESLVRTVAWAVSSYRAHGFVPDYWTLQIPAWLAALEEHLDHEDRRAVEPVYRWLEEHMPHFFALTGQGWTD